MLGPCAYSGCPVSADEELGVEPCVVCKKVVHHLCANEIHEGELNDRVCSLSCAVVHTGVPETKTRKPGMKKITARTKTAQTKSKKSDSSRALPSEGVSADESGSDGKSATKGKFFFTAGADLALLKEVLHLRPYAGEHGQKGTKWQDVTDNINEHLKEDLSVRTVKERLALLVKDFAKADASYRRKSGTAEDCTEHKQLLQDITSQIRDTKEQKDTKKDQKKARTEKLETYGEKLREQARKRQCQPKENSLAVDESASGTGAEKADDQQQDKQQGETTQNPHSLSNAQTNAVIADFLETQARAREEGQQQASEDLRFKQEKARKEDERWQRNFEFQREQADAMAHRWEEEAAIRREEAAIRREELTLLRMQLELNERRRER